MKLISLLSLLVLPLTSLAQSFIIEVLIVQLPEARAVELLPKFSTRDGSETAHKELVAMIGKEVELVDWPILTAMAGQQISAENVETVSFPTDYDQPVILLEESAEKGTAQNGEKADAAAGTSGKPGGAAPRIAGAVPDSFETKVLGVTVQAEAQTSVDGGRHSLNLSVSHSRLLGMQKITLEALPDYKVTVEQPRIHAIKTAANYDLTDGERRLVSFSKLAEPKGKVEIAIVTLRALPEPKAPPSEGSRKP